MAAWVNLFWSDFIRYTFSQPCQIKIMLFFKRINCKSDRHFLHQHLHFFKFKSHQYAKPHVNLIHFITVEYLLFANGVYCDLIENKMWGTDLISHFIEKSKSKGLIILKIMDMLAFARIATLLLEKHTIESKSFDSKVWLYFGMMEYVQMAENFQRL